MEGGYRLWAAVTHEVTRIICDARPQLRHNRILRAVLEYTRGDWIEWKTEITIRDLDAQIAAIKTSWRPDDDPIIEDDGRELRIRAPWFDPSLYARDPYDPSAPDSSN